MTTLTSFLPTIILVVIAVIVITIIMYFQNRGEKPRSKFNNSVLEYEND